MELENEADTPVAELRQLLSAKLPYVRSIYNDVATVRLVKRAYYLKKGCLAGSARTDNAHHLAFVYVQVDSLEYLQ